MKKCRINNKWDLILPEHRQVQWSHLWEEKRIDSMYEHLTDKDVLFYVGAEEGDIPALCSKWVSKVVLFEPGKRVWSNIKAIWDANKLSLPMCYVGFASDKTTNNIFFKGFPPDTSDEIITDHGFMELRNRNADEIKLDDVPIVSTVVPTALSIDVEGSEWHVLKGAEKTLKKYHPKIWLSVHPEFMFNQFGTYQADLRNWIKDLGYTEKLLDYQHEVHLYYEKADFGTIEEVALK